MSCIEEGIKAWENDVIVKVGEGRVTAGTLKQYNIFINSIMNFGSLPKPNRRYTNDFLETFIPILIQKILNLASSTSLLNKFLYSLIPLFVKRIGGQKTEFVKACVRIVETPNQPFYQSSYQINKTTKIKEYPFYIKNLKHFARSSPIPQLNYVLRRTYYQAIGDLLFAVSPYSSKKLTSESMDLFIASWTKFLTNAKIEEIDEQQCWKNLQSINQVGIDPIKFDNLQVMVAIKLYNSSNPETKCRSIKTLYGVLINSKTVEHTKEVCQAILVSDLWQKDTVVSIGDIVSHDISVISDIISIGEILVNQGFLVKQGLIGLCSMFYKKKKIHVLSFLHSFSHFYFNLSASEKEWIWDVVLDIDGLETPLLKFAEEVAPFTPNNVREKAFMVVFEKYQQERKFYNEVNSALFALVFNDQDFIQNLNKKVHELIDAKADREIIIPILKAACKYCSDTSLIDAVIDLGIPPEFYEIIPLLESKHIVYTKDQFLKTLQLPVQSIIPICSYVKSISPEYTLLFFKKLQPSDPAEIGIAMIQQMNKNHSKVTEFLGINEIWQLAFSNIDYGDELVRLYIAADDPSVYSDFVERCARRLDERIALTLLDKLIHRVEDGIEKESLGIQINRFRPNLVSVTLTGVVEGVLAIPKGSSMSSLRQKIASQLCVDPDNIALTRSSEPGPNDVLASSEVFDVNLLTDDEPDPDESTIILPSTLLQKYFNTLFPMLRSENAAIVYSILNEMQMSQEEYDTIDTDRSIEYTIDAPYLLLYRLNIVARLLDDKENDFSEEFIENGEAQRLFDFIFESHSLFQNQDDLLVNIATLLTDHADLFTPENAENALAWSIKTSDSLHELDSLLSVAPIECICNSRSFTPFIIKLIFADEKARRLSAMKILEKITVDFRPYLNQAIHKNCQEYFTALSNQGLDAIFLNKIIDIVYKYYGPHGQLLEELEADLPTNDFLFGCLKIINKLQKTYPIPDENKFFSFLIDRLLFNPFKKIVLPRDFYELIGDIISRNSMLSVQLIPPPGPRFKKVSCRYGASIKLYSQCKSFFHAYLSVPDPSHLDFQDALLVYKFRPEAIELGDEYLLDSFLPLKMKVFRDGQAIDTTQLQPGDKLVEAPYLLCVDKNENATLEISTVDDRSVIFTLVASDSKYSVYQPSSTNKDEYSIHPDLVQRAAKIISSELLNELSVDNQFNNFLIKLVDIGLPPFLFGLFKIICDIPNEFKRRIIQCVKPLLDDPKNAAKFNKSVKGSITSLMKCHNLEIRLSFINLVLKSIKASGDFSFYLQWLDTAKVEKLCFDEFLIPFVWICENYPDTVDSTMIEQILDNYPDRPLSNAFKAISILGKKKEFDIQFYAKHLQTAANLQSFYSLVVPCIKDNFTECWIKIKSLHLSPTIAAGFWALGAAAGNIRHWAVLKPFSNDEVAEFFEALKIRLKTDITDFWIDSIDQWTTNFLTTSNTRISNAFVEVVKVSCDPLSLIQPMWNLLISPSILIQMNGYFSLLEWAVTAANDPHIILEGSSTLLLTLVRFTSDQNKKALLKFLAAVVGPLGSRFFFGNKRSYKHFLLMIGNIKYDAPDGDEAAFHMLSLVIPLFAPVFIKSLHFKSIVQYTFGSKLSGPQIQRIVEEYATKANSKSIAKTIWGKTAFAAGISSHEYIETSIFLLSLYPNVAKVFRKQEPVLIDSITRNDQICLLSQFVKDCEKGKDLSLQNYDKVLARLREFPEEIIDLMTSLLDIEPDETIKLVTAAIGTSLFSVCQSVSAAELLCKITKISRNSELIVNELCQIDLTRFDLIQPICDCLVSIEEYTTSIAPMMRIIKSGNPQAYSGNCEQLLLGICSHNPNKLMDIVMTCKKQMESDAKAVLSTGNHDILHNVKTRLIFIFHITQDSGPLGLQISLTADEQNKLADICDSENEIYVKDCAALIFRLS